MATNTLTLTASHALQLAFFKGSLPAVPSGQVVSTMSIVFDGPANSLFPAHTGGTLHGVNAGNGGQEKWELRLTTDPGDVYIVQIIPEQMQIVSVQVNLTAAP